MGGYAGYQRICLCSLSANVVVVTYIVVSNHGHAVVLAGSYEDAKLFGDELKRTYSQYSSSRYKEKNSMIRTDVDVQFLDSDWYLRNALAYVARNALDAGCNIDTYEWSGHRAMFRKGKAVAHSVAVASLSKREKEQTMRTKADLSKVCWRIDCEGKVVPESICCSKYLEDAFNNDQAFYLKVLGNVNMSEMRYKLVDGPRRMLVDSEFLKIAEDLSRVWFASEISCLPIPEKIRLVTYLYRVQRTSVPQLARAFGMEREQVRSILNVNVKGDA